MAEIEVRVSESPVCDFCSDPDPRYLEDCRDWTATAYDGTSLRSTGAWAACEACHTLVQRHDWQRLEARAIRRMRRKYPYVSLVDIRSGIHTQHTRFRDHQP